MSKLNSLSNKNILSLLVAMSFPPMVSMLIQSLYNIVDSYYVAKISNDAFVAVSLAYPLQNLVLAVAVGTGVAVNATVALNLGRKNSKMAKSYAQHGLFLTMIHCLIFIIFSLIGCRYFLNLFDQSAKVLELSLDYTYIVMIFSFGLLFHLIVEKLFQATGNMLYPMFLQIFGAVLNIVLDPILIFGLGFIPALGIKGAAIATVFSQILTAFLSYLIFRLKNKEIDLSMKNFKLDKYLVRKIYSIAIPSSLMCALPSLLVAILNLVLVEINEIGVAVFGLYYKLQTFVHLPANGIIQGIRPLISFNFGSKNYQKMKEIVKWSLVLVFALMGFGTLGFNLFAEKIIILFNGNYEMLRYGTKGLKIMSFGFIFASFSVIIAGYFEALGQGKASLMISLIRMFIITLPLAVILGFLYDLDGVWASIVIAEVAGMIAALFLYKKSINHLNN